MDLMALVDDDAPSVARHLIGTMLLVDGVGGVIVETEAYTIDDPASHSFRGIGKSNAAMFGPVGTAYVYRIYGLHHCLNVVCRNAGAVLVRAIEPRIGLDHMAVRRNLALRANGHGLANGPGKLCMALGVDLSMNGLALDRTPFLLVPAERAGVILTGKRIGISRNTGTPWRFGRAGSKHLSRPFEPRAGR